MRKLGFYPEVVSFIDEEKDEFPYVKVQYAYGSPPKLIMLDNEGQQKETIRSVSRSYSYSGMYHPGIFLEVMLHYWVMIYWCMIACRLFFHFYKTYYKIGLSEYHHLVVVNSEI